MSALYFLFLWVAEIFLGGLILSSFTRLIHTQWLKPFQNSERFLPAVYFAFLALFLMNFMQFPHIEDSGFRGIYFARDFFALRALFYFVVWALILWQQRRNRESGGALMIILILLTGSLASFDWLMSLSKDWESTVFGLIFLSSSTLMSYALWLYFFADDEDLIDRNNVHLALIGTWTYLSVAQLLTIWSGNLPREAHYYLLRTRPGWSAFPIVLALLQFAIPLFLLLFRRLKSSLKFTRTIAGISVVMQSVFLFWLLAPDLHPTTIVKWPELLLAAALLLALAARGFVHE